MSLKMLHSAVDGSHHVWPLVSPLLGCGPAGLRLAGLWASGDEAAVDAAWGQPPLQQTLLPLGGEDGDDGLVEHRLQALLCQG